MSSFGISGTNAHVILEEAPTAAGGVAGDGVPAGAPAPDPALPLPVPVPVPVPVSARSEAGLRAQAEVLRRYVAAHPDASPADIGAGLARGRAVLEHRAVILAEDRDELVQALTALAAGEPHPHLTTGHTRGSDRGSVVFVFPGQGGQWAGMAPTLLTSSPVFAQHIDACEKALAPYVRLVPHRHPAPRPRRPRMATSRRRSSPCSSAVMVSLAALWRSYGINPTPSSATPRARSPPPTLPERSP